VKRRGEERKRKGEMKLRLVPVFLARTPTIGKLKKKRPSGIKQNQPS